MVRCAAHRGHHAGSDVQPSAEADGYTLTDERLRQPQPKLRSAISSRVRSQKVQGPKSQPHARPASRICLTYNSGLSCKRTHKTAPASASSLFTQTQGRPPPPYIPGTSVADTALVGTLYEETHRHFLPLHLGGPAVFFRSRTQADQHAGLRFGDLQRIKLSSLSLTSNSLRGICWQTKTSKRGQPFAVTLAGVAGRSLASLWVLPFLAAVQSAWTGTEQAHSHFRCPDFILPVLNLGGWQRPNSIYLRPMSHTAKPGEVRDILPWQDASRPVPVTMEESSGFTLHSLKICLLAAGAQVRAAEEARQHQGHHKSPSVQLYSRDR